MLFQKQIENVYRSNLYVRNDNAQGIFYFKPEDFPGLSCHPYSFPAKAGHQLKGFFYHYPQPDATKLVIFDHGMGNGHRAYMREIERLAQPGFLVFSYDHTGCMASGGKDCNGFAQSLSDLDACIAALKQEDGLKGRDLCVCGHSWGGYSTMNITALHPEITHVVSMSGFVSVEAIVNQTFLGFLKGYRASILELERRSNPDYFAFDARNTLKNTSAKVLLIYSDNDSVVHKKDHYDVLRQALRGKDNIRFLLVEGKNHNPTYTLDAVTYKDAFFRDLQKVAKKKQLQTLQQQQAFMARYDWHRMTHQDDAVWKEIADALKS